MLECRVVTEMLRLGIFMSHPIQYQIGLLKEIEKNKHIELAVFYYWNFGLIESLDPEFDSKIKWDLPLLDGYKHKFIKNYSINKSANFLGCINPGVISVIFRKEIDVAMIYGWALLSNWFVVISCLLSRTPILLCAETPLCHELSKKGVGAFIRKIVLRLLFSKISGFLYLGEQNRRFYKYHNVPEEKLYFTPYAVDNDRHFKFREQNNFKKNIDNAIKILFVGKLIDKKKPMDLIKAFELLQQKKQTIKLELWIVGSGKQQEALEKYVADNHIKSVIFWGFRNQTELCQFYQDADIFVLPSGYGETWGLVVNEAMCYGKPIIVSDLVGCGLDLVTEKNGFIFPFGNVLKLMETLELLIRNSSLRDSYGKESLSIIKKYSHEISATMIAQAAYLVADEN